MNAKLQFHAYIDKPSKRKIVLAHKSEVCHTVPLITPPLFLFLKAKSSICHSLHVNKG